MSAGLALHLTGVHKSFGAVAALRGVDLDIPVGSTFGLVGPNGAGKTTLFSLAAGFLRPTSGEVRALGWPVGDPRLRGRLSVLPQDALWRRGLTVGEHLRLCAALQGFGPPQAAAEVDRALELTGMREARERMPATLSHGMAKRVAIAQAFLGQPELVLLDEPLAGLDPAQARSVRLLLQAEAGRRTFVISSHVMADIETLCTHVAIIQAGRIVAQPTLGELTRREAVAVFTLATPPAADLAAGFEALPYISRVELRAVERKLQLTVRTDLKSLDEAVADCIRLLSERGVSFVGIQKGTSLEDAVLKLQ